MKKNICILILIILFLGLSFCLGFRYVRYEKNKEKELLVESSTINYARGLVYIGEAILDDGSSYLEENTTKEADEIMEIIKKY